ncbi:MAG: M23 family metallopeptidase [Alphaproteobacteria bacterium]
MAAKLLLLPVMLAAMVVVEFGQQRAAYAAGCPAGGVIPMTGIVTSPFGPRWGRNHNGFDISSGGNAPVVAVAPGRVSWVCASGGEGCSGGEGYGNRIIIDHGNCSSTYSHLKEGSVFVQEGQQVTTGQQIGIEGNTGIGTGDHLHFEIQNNGAFIDPSICYAQLQNGASITAKVVGTALGAGAMNSSTSGGPGSTPTPYYGCYAEWAKIQTKVSVIKGNENFVQDTARLTQPGLGGGKTSMAASVSTIAANMPGQNNLQPVIRLASLFLPAGSDMPPLLETTTHPYEQGRLSLRVIKTPGHEDDGLMSRMEVASQYGASSLGAAAASAAAAGVTAAAAKQDAGTLSCFDDFVKNLKGPNFSFVFNIDAILDSMASQLTSFVCQKAQEMFTQNVKQYLSPQNLYALLPASVLGDAGVAAQLGAVQGLVNAGVIKPNLSITIK